MVKIFKDDEGSYNSWRNKHLDGFVLNTTRNKSISYLVLHRSGCQKISKPAPGMASNPFTGRGYIKICADSIRALERWIQEIGGRGFTKECKRCMRISSRDVGFDTEVKQSITDSPEKRRARLAMAPKKPRFRYIEQKNFIRNPDVIEEVLWRARGRCEKCKKEAPFKRSEDGSPYLEVHHRKTLADGGEDTVQNAEALCPNCHRQKHYG
jgi:5-methylcytosine-specific restriction endonuclease McrA